MKRDNIVREKSLAFAVRAVNLYKVLTGERGERVMSKQLLRSGTSVGANVREALNAESTADFTHKLAIAQKRVTYDFHRLMDGAVKLSCSEFGQALVENM